MKTDDNIMSIEVLNMYNFINIWHIKMKGMIKVDTSFEKKLNLILDKHEINDYNPWIKGKRELGRWLHLSSETVDRMLKAGLPYHFVGDIEIYFFNKEEITEFISKQ